MIANRIVVGFALFCAIAPVWGQREARIPGTRGEQEQASRMSRLNQVTLQLHAESRQLHGTALRTHQRRAIEHFQQRAAAMRELIQQDPAEALRQSFGPDAVRELVEAFPGAESLLEEYGQWDGDVRTRAADTPDQQTEHILHQLHSGGETIDVYMAGPEPESKCGDTVSFEGIRQGSVMAASKAKVMASTSTTVTCGPIGEQKAVALLVTFPGVTPPSTVTTQNVQNAFFGTTGRSLDLFWRESSYNKTWTTGDVYGWFTLDAAYNCTQPDQMLAAAIKAADSTVNFQNYSRVFLIFPKPAGCAYAGLSDVGCSTYTSPADGTFRSSAHWLVADYFSTSDQGAKLLVHEAGHGLGLGHSRSRDFNFDPLGALGSAGTINTYGDINSAMGSWNFGHYTGSQKLGLGWQTGGSNVLTVQSSGSYTIQPTGVATTGAQTLKIQRGTGNSSWLWVEYRQPTGPFNSTLNSQLFKGALIHYQDSNTTGNYTDLLDFTNLTSSFTDPSLAAGQTWVDPYSNLTLSVQSATSAGLTVNVSYGASLNTCTPASPAVTATPINPAGYPGSAVKYTVTVTNKDSGGCLARTFNLGSTLPSAWPSSFSAASVTLGPGQSATSTMTKTSPAATVPNVYAVDASAVASTNMAQTATSNASVTVLAPPPPLYVTPVTDAASYLLGSTVKMTATVLSGANLASGASVVFTLKKANGTTVTSTVTTGTSGQAIWNYLLPLTDPTGVDTVTVKATLSTQSATGGPATFTVQ